VKTYVVGGAVRDELLGLPVQDRDHVVVGATPEDMAAAGFKPVGKDFPVFLHPETQEEYALARTERKSGRGYKGFTVHAAPDVSLEDDLRRRDLTINAMAKAPDGTLVDPFHGEKDLKKGVLRHVSEAFAEDPERMLDALERSGLRARLMPELATWPRNFSGPRAVRYALLCWPIGEAALGALSDRLRVPNDERELAALAVRLKDSLQVKTANGLLEVLRRADAFRRPERFEQLLEVATQAAPGFDKTTLRKALQAAAAVDAGEIARRASAPAAIPGLLDQAREAAIKDALN